jgi:capsular polysaccharide biosynthesis protein
VPISKENLPVELMLFIRVLLRRWLLVAIPVVIAAAVAVPALLAPASASGGGYSTVIRYTAAQVIEAIPGRDGDFQDVWLASELAVNAFTEWIRSGSFRDEVRARLPADVAERVNAGTFGADNERSIGQLFIAATDAATLEQFAEAAQSVLTTQTGAYFPQLGGQPAQVTLLDRPEISAAPAPITSRLGPLIQLAVALLGGIGLAFLVEYLDPYIYRRDQLDALDLRVVAVVPTHRGRR